MLQFLLSGLRVGIRGRSFQVVLIFGIALLAVAYLSGSFSPRQPATVALDVGLSGVRLTLVMLVLFWVQELFTREIDRRIILFSFTYPVSRADFVLGRFTAILVLTLISLLVLGLALTLAVIFSGKGYAQGFPVALGFPLWTALTGVALDVTVVAAVGICVAAVSTVAMMPLAIGFAFAVAGKALGPSLQYLNAGADGDAELIASVGSSIEIIRWLIPDLSRLDWRNWPLYSVQTPIADMAWSALMAIAYTGLLLSLTVHALRHREFS